LSAAGPTLAFPPRSLLFPFRATGRPFVRTLSLFPQGLSTAIFKRVFLPIVVERKVTSPCCPRATRFCSPPPKRRFKRKWKYIVVYLKVHGKKEITVGRQFLCFLRPWFRKSILVNGTLGLQEIEGRWEESRMAQCFFSGVLQLGTSRKLILADAGLTWYLLRFRMSARLILCKLCLYVYVGDLGLVRCQPQRPFPSVQTRWFRWPLRSNRSFAVSFYEKQVSIIHFFNGPCVVFSSFSEGNKHSRIG